VRPIAPACPRFALLPAFPAVARVAYGAPRLARRRNRRVVDAKHEGRAHACAAALSESASAAVQASQRRISQPGVSQRGVSQRGQPMPSATHRGRQLGQMAVAQGLMRCSCAVLPHRRIIPRRVRFSGDGLSLKKSPRRGSRHQLVGLRARDRAASSRTVTQATARFGWCGRSTATTTRQRLLSLSGCWSLIERRGGARSTATLSRRLYLAATDAVVIGACLAGPQVAGRGREPMLSSAASAAVACVQHPDA
jgi:hypothetical protein